MRDGRDGAAGVETTWNSKARMDGSEGVREVRFGHSCSGQPHLGWGEHAELVMVIVRFEFVRIMPSFCYGASPCGLAREAGGLGMPGRHHLPSGRPRGWNIPCEFSDSQVFMHGRLFEYTLLFACSFGSPSSISFPGEPERASHQEVIESGIGGVDGHRVPQRRNRQCEWAVTKQMTTELVMNRRKTYATLHASPRARGTRVKLGTQGGGVGHTAA